MFDPDSIPIENPPRHMETLRRELVKLDVQLSAAPRSPFIRQRHKLYTETLRDLEVIEIRKASR